MPVAFNIECLSASPKGLRLEQCNGRQLQGAFLEAVRRISPKDAEALHEGNQEKPYTVSLLERPRQNKAPTQKFRLRVVLLDDALFPLVLRLQGATNQEPLTLGHQSIRFQSIHMGTGHEPDWTGCAMWSQLIQQASVGRIFRLELATPTCFKQSNMETKRRLEMPLPLPELVFGSALKRWQMWSEHSFHDGLKEAISWGVEITHPMRLEAYEVELPIKGTTRRIVGSTGVVTFRIIDKELPEQITKELNALADGLIFTGAGQRTALGMGRLRRLTNQNA